MKLLTKEQQELYENAKICYICEGKFENKYLKDKKYCKLEITIIIQGEYRSSVHIMHTKRFFIKELAEEFKK